ncbi:RHS repeat-associated protein [Bacteroides heparinolyticus]|uniref:RHS repeat-associated protein n=1 Tax=Prevotella heparinolytica TaxID=28113 RepID=A0A4R2LS79_9BACE|nr:RHS repeat-associated protein [Bacteroides heparinolyticus]
MIYENGIQKLLITEKGYITLADGKYHYYLKDHQGNNRVVIDHSGTVEEVNHYYPFGGTFAGTNSIQPYKYNGKELDASKGLNWYDYGARHYDAALGRFTTVDRFAEKYYSLSPFQYGANNPANNIDINGDSIIIKPNENGVVDKVKQLLGYDTKYQKDVKADLWQLKQDDSEVAKIISQLEESKNIHYITMPKKGAYNSTRIDAEKVRRQISQGSEIYYNPYSQRKNEINKEVRLPRIGLAHELQHSFDVDKKIATYESTKNGILLMEVRAINTENRIRRVVGAPKRITYGSQKVPEELLE